MKKHTSPLAAKVAAVNSANAYANALFPLLSAALSPFMGQQVEKVAGGLLEKVKRALPILPPFPVGAPLGWQVYRDPSGYALRWTVKACELYGEHSCVYHEVSVFVANLRNGVAEKWNGAPFQPLRTDYTEAEIFALRAANAAAKKAASEAASALFPFGEFDR